MRALRLGRSLVAAAMASTTVLACLYSVPDVIPQATLVPGDGSVFVPTVDGGSRDAGGDACDGCAAVLAAELGTITAFTLDERTSTLLYAVERGVTDLKSLSLVGSNANSAVKTATEVSRITGIAGISDENRIVYLAGPDLRLTDNAANSIGVTITFAPPDGGVKPLVVVARGLDLARKVVFAGANDALFEVGYGLPASTTRLANLPGPPSTMALVSGAIFWLEASGNQQVLARKELPSAFDAVTRSLPSFERALWFNGQSGVAAASARTLVALDATKVDPVAQLCSSTGVVSTLTAIQDPTPGALPVPYWTEGTSNVLLTCTPSGMVRSERATLLDENEPLRVFGLVALGDSVYVAGTVMASPPRSSIVRLPR